MASAAERVIPEKKATSVKEFREAHKKASSMIFLGFKGLDVVQVTDLRARFRKAGVQYKVVKNKLIQQALKGSALEGSPALKKALAGETGVAFSFEDPSAAAKVVRDFRKEGDDAKKLQVKAGVVETSVMVGEEVAEQMAAMPGKDEIRAMLLGTLSAPLQKTLATLQAPLQSFVYLLEARRKQLGGEDNPPA